MIIAKSQSSIDSHQLSSAFIKTPIGTLLAIADDVNLYRLVFDDAKGKGIQSLSHGSTITAGKTAIIKQTEEELAAYFKGNLSQFTIPLALMGTDFQKSVWRALIDIPSGETRSYEAVAHTIGRPTACRAVARANATNQLPIIIPCHRVINKNGSLGGYGGGIERKQWLLHHEKMSSHR
ncbi:MAG: methylated-DNA--[protein]-cysteine S-methyltransferase [Gammaproteobacteria bacterium]